MVEGTVTTGGLDVWHIDIIHSPSGEVAMRTRLLTPSSCWPLYLQRNCGVHEQQVAETRNASSTNKQHQVMKKVLLNFVMMGPWL